MTAMPAAPDGGAVRVLVIDDEPAIRRLLMRILRGAGHQADAVGTAQEAIMRTLADDYDVVMCDLGLGAADGVEVLRTIMSREPHPAAIVVTGDISPETAERVLAVGAAGYITKPFKNGDIVIAVNQALRRRDEDHQRARRQRAMEVELRFRAECDPLTGLWNRTRFVRDLEQQLREPCASGALVVVDLDHFKMINDSRGHSAGDNALRTAAGMLRTATRSCDSVARTGGDEFALLLPRATPALAERIGRKLIEQLSDPAVAPLAGASLGIATFGPDERFLAEDLLGAAGHALHDAKEAGRGRFARYAGPTASSLTWMDRIRRALREDRLVAFAQPILDLRSNEVIREELLVRMRGERGELIAPAAFLPTAERYGLITQIDAWMLARALEFVADGRAVNLNLSGRTLEEGRYVETIERHAGTCDLSLLTIEITETSHVSDLAGVRDSAHRLAGLGCGLALDDFGTGYATLSYLKHLPIACIKIDREFIEHLATDPRDQRIVEALVGIARAADQQTVAEGVENAEALELLRRLGVDHAQGYFIGRPAPAERTPPPDSEVDLAQADGEGDGVHAGVGVELAHRVADMGANGLR